MHIDRDAIAAQLRKPETRQRRTARAKASRPRAYRARARLDRAFGLHSSARPRRAARSSRGSPAPQQRERVEQREQRNGGLKRRSPSKPNGTPWNRLPMATPNTSAGTRPLTNSAQSQMRATRGPHFAAELECRPAAGSAPPAPAASPDRSPRSSRRRARARRQKSRRPQDQPDLVALPDRSHRVDHHPSLGVSARDEGQQRRTPRSKPSMTAKPISSTPSSSHQIDAGFHSRTWRLLRSTTAASCAAAASGPSRTYFMQQIHVDDGEHRIEQHEPHRLTMTLLPRSKTRQERRQHALDRPGLAAVFGHKPAQLGGDPGQRQADRARALRNQRYCPAGACRRARRRLRKAR